MSDSEVKTSETKTPSARKPRTNKAAAPAVVVAEAPKVRKPRVKKETTAAAAPAEAKAPAKPRKTAAKRAAKLKVTPDQRHDMVCTAAYFIAEKRGFTHGYDHDDWLAAEMQVDATIELI
jgi:hypothetical protein